MIKGIAYSTTVALDLLIKVLNTIILQDPGGVLELDSVRLLDRVDIKAFEPHNRLHMPFQGVKLAQPVTTHNSQNFALWEICWSEIISQQQVMAWTYLIMAYLCNLE